MTLAKGELVRDRYRIILILVQHDQDTLYLAHDEVLNIDITLKENLYTTVEHSKQFRQEATILAKLRHPNLPRVSDHFVIEGSGEYLVMDYVEGENLNQRLTRINQPLSEEEVVRIGMVVSQALAYLHSRRPPIIHRDIKPENLKMTDDGQVLLVDFGHAKIFDQAAVTASGAHGISPGYSPVEQYGHGTDERSDIYALGATLYFLLTCERPPEAINRAMYEDQLNPITEINPLVSTALKNVIERAMAIKASDRYQHTADLNQALFEAFPLPDMKAFSAVESETSTPAKSKSDIPPVDSTIRLPPQKNKRVLFWLIPVILLLISGVAAGFFFLSKDRAEDSPISKMSTSTREIIAALPKERTLTATPIREQPTMTQTLPTLEMTATLTVTLTPQPVGTSLGGGRSQFAFVSDRSGSPQIYLINADGTGLEQLTSEIEGACQPEWAPDGLRMAFVSPCTGRDDDHGGASIYIMDLDTGRIDLISQLAAGDYDPAWSPDGRKLAFTSLQTGKPQIFIYDFDTGEAQLLMNRSIINQMPAWSPDGGQVIFVALDPTSNLPVLYSVDSAGQSEPKIISGGNYQGTLHPAWSPEADLVIFELAGKGEIGARILSDNQDASINSQLVTVENPTFSSDAYWIICSGVLDLGEHDIFLMSPTGDQLTNITNDPADDYQPVWRP